MFHFSEDQFNHIFPFHVVINRNLELESFGKSIAKICPMQRGDLFSSHFIIKLPFTSITNFEDLLAMQDQLIICEHCLDALVILRGQVEYLAEKDCVLFIGSPWFNNMDQVVKRNLSSSDFAHHDPLINLLQVLKTQEVVNKDTRKLLADVNKQRKELLRLSTIAQQSTNTVIITGKTGLIEWINKAFEENTGYTLEEVKGKKPGAFLQGKDSDPDSIRYMSESIKNGLAFNCVLLNYNKSGEPFWARIIAQPTKDKTGKVLNYFAVQENITQQKNLESEINSYAQKIMEQSDFYENILDNIPGDIVVVDLESRHLFVNKMAVKNPEVRAWLIGKTNEEYVAYRNKPTALGESRRRYFNEVVRTKQMESWEEEAVSPNGEIEYKLRNMFPVLDETGNLKLVIGYGIDVTELKKVQQELQLAKQKTEEMAAAKQQFLVNMSHEIRTPMNGILGIAGLLHKSQINQHQQELVDIIEESAQNLLVIINDVLDLEKTIAGKIELEVIPFRFTDKIRATIESFRYKAVEKGLMLRYDNYTAEDLVVIGDPFRLTQILNNLINNALKFTDQGSVILTTSLKTQQADHLIIEFKVTDTGIGIDEDRLTEIFEPFVQANAGTSRLYGGSGLGLSICRDLVTRMGGTLQVHSRKGQGACFQFNLPYTVSDVNIHTHLPMQIDKHIVQHLNILIADDVEINQILIKHILQSWDCTFTIVDNGKKVLEEMEQTSYDLILMDIQMPEMNGVDATLAIRQLKDPLKAATPIIALTANALKGDSEYYVSLGMNGYLSKPFNEAGLFDVIVQVVNALDNTARVPQQEVLRYNLKQLQALSKGDENFVRQMIHLFIKTLMPIQLQLQHETARGHWQNVAAIMHKIKPMLDSMGIQTAVEMVGVVEKNAKSGLHIDLLPAQVDAINQILDQCLLQLKRAFPPN